MKNSVLALAVVFGSVSASLAGVVTPEADPMGTTTYKTLMGSEGTPVGGTEWFEVDGGEAMFAARTDQEILYTTDLVENEWRVGLTARNSGILPEWYSNFRVEVFVNEVFLSEVVLPAIDGEYRTTWFDIGMQSGETDLRLVWKNDFWVPNTYDANIVIGAVQFGQVVPAAPTVGVFALAGLAASRRHR